MRGKPACPVLRGLRRGNAPELPDQIYFSVIERKVVSPNDFTNLEQVERRLADFELRYNATARPFQWKFTPTDLDDHLARINQHQQQAAAPPIPQAA